MSASIQEYVIKLSAQMDNSGVSQILSLLDSTKLKTLGVTAALSAATTAVYKLISSVVEEEFKMKSLSKTQGKTVETVRASETALKAMGKTLKDINKDKELKTIYNDIQEVNKSLALPNMEKTLTNIRQLQGNFWKLKSVADYAIEWIGVRILKQLEEPINRISQKIDDFTNWVREDFNGITSTLSSYITGFAKGIIGIAESVEQIVGWILDLPGGIGKIGIAAAALWAIIKSGPVGWILTLVTAIGGLIDDYDNWKWNQQHSDEEPIPVAFAPVWKIVDDDSMTVVEKFSAIGKVLVDNITKAIDKIPAGELGTYFGQLITDIFRKLGEWVSGADNLSDEVFGSLGGAFKALGGKVFEFIASVFQSINLTDVDKSINKIAESIFGIIGKGLSAFVQGTTDLVNLSESDQGSSVLLGLAKSIVSGLESGMKTLTPEMLADSLTTIASNLIKLIKRGVSNLITLAVGKTDETSGEYQKGLLQYGIEIFTDIFRYISQAAAEVGWEDLGVDAADLINTIFTKITDFLTNGTGDVTELPVQILTAAKNIAGGILKAISSAFFTLAETDDNSESAITRFAEGLWTGIENAIKNLSDLLTKPIEEGGIDTEAVGKDIGGQIGEFIGNAIKVGTQWISTFLSEAIEFLSTGEGFEKLLQIGKAIVDGIIAGVGSLYEAIMRTLFGDNWVSPEERKETSNEVAGLFTDEETGEAKTTITGANGKEYTWDQAQELAGKNTRGAQAIFGLRDETDFESYKKAFYGALGADTLAGNLGYSETFGSDIAKLFGLAYDEANGQFLYNNMPIGGDVQGDLYTYLNSLSTAGDQDTFYRLFSEIAALLSENGIGNGLDVEGAGKAAEESLNAPAAPETPETPNISGAIDPSKWKGIVGEAGFSDVSPTVEKLGDSADDASDGLTDLDTDTGELSKKFIKAREDAKGLADHLSSAKTASKNAASALEALISAAESAATALKSVKSGGGGDGDSDSSPEIPSAVPRGSIGGRFASEKQMVIGEDGTEYLIPITKPERAFPLLNQMFGEMGPSALKRIASDFGLGVSGTVGGSLASLSSAMQGMSMNNTFNITAPVTINVTSTAASAEEVGANIYDLAERNLIRNLRGVYA